MEQLTTPSLKRARRCCAEMKTDLAPLRERRKRTTPDPYSSSSKGRMQELVIL